MRPTIIIVLMAISAQIFSQSSKDSLVVERIIRSKNFINEKYFYEKLTSQNRIAEENLEKKLADLERTIDRHTTQTDRTFELISKQIEAASLSMTILGIIVGAVSLLLGIYITVIERKIVKINSLNKDLLSKNQKIKQDVEDINTLIQKDIYGLFLKIKREETIHILDRLRLVPEDITNVINQLVSRNLEEEDYTKIKMAYQKLSENGGEEYVDNYHLVFFQHFFGKVLRDEEIRHRFIAFIPNGIDCSFENDILNSTKDMIVSMVDGGLQNYKREIEKYFEGLLQSHFKNLALND